MYIGVRSHFNITVAEILLDGIDIHTVAPQGRAARVPQLMRSQAGDIGWQGIHELVISSSKPVRVSGLANSVRKDIRAAARNRGEYIQAFIREGKNTT